MDHLTMPTDGTDTDQDFGDESDYDDYDCGIEWYCNHDVPNGCGPCAQDRRINDMLDNMTDQERQDWLYGAGGTFETFFAPGGPAFQQGL